VFDFSEGGMEQLDLLGGQGANVVEMTRLGLQGATRVHYHH
jgi:phosphoenolpyruvate synthase/pyruvate phosphate dikinase